MERNTYISAFFLTHIKNASIIIIHVFWTLNKIKAAYRRTHMENLKRKIKDRLSCFISDGQLLLIMLAIFLGNLLAAVIILLLILGIIGGAFFVCVWVLVSLIRLF